MSVSTPVNHLQIFQTRREYCVALLELSLQQGRLIADDDYPQLLKVLQQKQHLIGRLQDYTRTYAALWNQWKQQREQLEPQQQADCDRVLDETEQILAQLLQVESESTTDLKQRRDATQQTLQNVSQGNQAHLAYHDTQAPATHRFLNVDQ